MSTLRTLLLFSNSNLKNIKSISRFQLTNYERFYSVFPSNYVKPVYNKDAQKQLDATGEIKVLSHLPIKPAFTNENSSDFYDPVIQKFINYLMKGGNKLLARNLLVRTFENIKRIQIERYNKSSPEEQPNIELDPKTILYKAIENSTPVLELMKMKKGGQTYQVPVPLTEKKAEFIAMRWLIRTGMEKDKSVHLPERLAYELIDASNNQGRVIRKKQELYRQCEANRSYAHFRWT